jgi:hypothetical protein
MGQVIEYAGLSRAPERDELRSAKPAKGQLPGAIIGPEDRPAPVANYRLRCRCGRVYDIGVQRLTTAMSRARGRERLIVGVGSYATEHGGADL